MTSETMKKYAKTLVQYSLYVKEGEWVIIRGSNLALPLIKEVYREVLAAGAYPTVSITPEGIDEILLTEGSEAQLQFINPLSETTMTRADKVLTILGSENTKSLSSIDPFRIALTKRAGAELNQIYRKRIADGLVDWTLCLYPTQSGAQEAGMSLSEFETFVYKACLLDCDDPIAAWKDVHFEQQHMVDYLDRINEFRIISVDTDLSLSATGRTWANSDGHRNFPSGEVFTAPVKESLNGYVRFSYPGIYAGQAIEDIRLVFSEGKVVEARAKTGEGLLKALIDTDEGSCYAGEFAIGTNFGIDRFTKNMLFDEKTGGTIHIALGSSYPECGGDNESAIHWDMLCDMKTAGQIFADGELCYEKGKFLK